MIPTNQDPFSVYPAEKNMAQIHIKGHSSLPLGKIIGLGRNYLDHIRELGNTITEEPVLFCKPPSSVIGHNGLIEIPNYSQNCQHELELAILIGVKGKNIPQQQAFDHISGYGVALDLTLRDVQSDLKEKGLPWDIAKGFDTSCPLSSFVPAATVNHPDNLDMTLSINGQLRQQGNTAQMMRPIKDIIAAVSRYFTLMPGDIILTGTPAGVAQIHSGDRLVATIDHVGTLKVSVK
jgi:5-carboxymethyl-2-hydroxymuconate isomerase